MSPSRGAPLAGGPLCSPSSRMAVEDSFERRTPLELSRVSEAHLLRLTQSYQRFDLWCRRRHISLDNIVSDPESVSSLLAHYVQHCKNTGLALWHGRLAILGVQHLHRPLHGKLKKAWDAIASWQLEVPSRNRTPIHQDMVDAMALLYAETALQSRERAECLWAMVILVRLGFQSLLRPQDIFELSVGDLAFPPPRR